MKAYKCDMCLKYCDEVFPYVDLVLIKHNGQKRKINQLCDRCWKKLIDWVNENIVLEESTP